MTKRRRPAPHRCLLKGLIKARRPMLNKVRCCVLMPLESALEGRLGGNTTKAGKIECMKYINIINEYKYEFIKGT